MNYLAVHDYFKDVSQNLGASVKWFHGRRSIQNLTKFEGGFYFFSNPFTSAGSLTDGIRQVNDTWTASITIAMQDQADGDIDQNNEDDLQPSIRAITLCENIAEKYIHYINENTINDSLSSSAQEINFVSVNKSPVFRDTAYMLSGITLDISFTVMDDFDYCCDPVSGVNPSPITNFVYSNNGQSVESGGFQSMFATVTPTDGTYTYFLNPSDTLPTGLNLNGATSEISRVGTIPNGSYAFNVIVVGSGLASGIATVEVTLTVASIVPTLTNATDTSTGETTGSGTVDTDEGNGTLYWVVTQSATTPSAAQIIAGQDHTGGPADDSGNQAVSATGTQNVSFTGLTQATTYYAHFVQKDSDLNNSNTISADGFTTDSSYQYLLDEYTGATVAYALTKLRSAYAGSAIRVRRSSDNSEQDIGFSGNDLDESALTTFCGAGDGFVTTWYDQSTTGVNLIQTTTANQPQIVSSGTVIKQNTIPAISPDGINDLLQAISSGTFNGLQSGNLSFFYVSEITTAINKINYSLGTSSGELSDIIIGSGATQNDLLYRGNDFVSVTFNQASDTYLFSIIDKSGGDIYVNGSAKGTAAGDRNINPDRLTLFGRRTGGAVEYNGDMQLFVFYASDQSTNRTAIETIINDIYLVY